MDVQGPGSTVQRGKAGGWKGLLVSLCALWVGVLCSAHYDQMFLDGHLGYAGALRGVIGQNYLRHDPLETRFAPLQNGGPSYNEQPSVRYNHPPLTGMLVGLSFAVFGGASEAAARLVPIVASLLTVPLLFGWVRRVWGDHIAAVALVLWCTAPFVAIYGAMVSYEPLVLLFWNLLLWAWATWRWGKQKRMSVPLVAAVLGVVLGLWTDWPMVVLVLGLIVAEATILASENQRRRAFLLTVTTALTAALGALAIYYLVVLDIDHARLASLYQRRSSLGDWSGWDAAAHIALRTSLLLTVPVALASMLGLGLQAKGGQAKSIFLFFVALLLPPLALLLLLPQHAVIHCFSAWYLLPSVVVSAGVAIVFVGRIVVAGFGRVTAQVVGAGFSAIVLWQAIPAVTDGWISDGSPFEGQPRLEYQHLVLARWVGEHTDSGDVLLIDEETGAVGVRAWFQHDRALFRLDPSQPIDVALREGDPTMAIVSRRHIDGATFRRLASLHAITIFNDVFVIDRRRPGPQVEVLELVEEQPTWWWTIAHSASYPPYRLEDAPERAAVYDSQRSAHPISAAVPQASDPSLATLAARHLLAGPGPASEPQERSLLESLTARVDEALCEELAWVGVIVDHRPNGRVALRLLLRATTATQTLPQVGAELVGQSSSRPAVSWSVISDDAFSFPESSFIVASHWLPVVRFSGSYHVTLRACGHSVQSPQVQLQPQTLLPTMPRVGLL